LEAARLGWRCACCASTGGGHVILERVQVDGRWRNGRMEPRRFQFPELRLNWTATRSP
jgi:hypothetical protein